MNSHPCVPQTVGILWNHERLISFRLVLLVFTNLDRHCLGQEPYMVLVSTTTSLNVPVKLNLCKEQYVFLGCSREKHEHKLRLYTAPVMEHLKYGIRVTPYWVISVTSPYELYMWKVIFLCAGEIWLARLHQAIDTSLKSYLLTCLSCWQAQLAALVQLSRYVMISSILYSILSFIKVTSSTIRRSWLTSSSITLPSSSSALTWYTSAPETSENIELRLPTEDNRRIQVCLFYYYGEIRTTGRLYPAFCEFLLKSHSFVMKEYPLGDIMVVIFPVINTAFVTTKCRELVILQMWLLKISFYPLTARILQRCVTSSSSVLGQEYFQRYNLLFTRDYVWLFYKLMTSPCEVGNLSVCKSVDECCLKLGYFTAQTVIYLLFYSRYIALDMDDHDGTQSSDDADTAQSRESDDGSNTLDQTITPAVDNSIEAQTLGFVISMGAQDPELMGRLDSRGRQFVEELVTPVGNHGRRTDDTPRISPELVVTPFRSSGDSSAVRGARDAIEWAARAHEFEEHQRARGIRTESLAMGALASTPENRVPVVMAQPVVEPTFHEREHLQSLRNMRDQSHALARDLGGMREQMRADVEQSDVELQDAQERFEADRQRFREETQEGQQHRLPSSHHHYSGTHRRSHAVAEELPLCAICGDRTNRRVYQDLDPNSPTYQECSTTCSRNCRDLERRAIEEVDMMARVRLLSDQRVADDISTVSGESSVGSQQHSRVSRPCRSKNRRFSHQPSRPVSHASRSHRDADSRGRGGSDGGSSSSSSRRSTRSRQPESGIAQALVQATQALAANQALCSQLQLELSALRTSNQSLMDSNQVNQANNAVLAARLKVVEQGVMGTPGCSSSGISRLTPQAPPSATLNQSATPLDSGSVKRMRVRDLSTPMLPSAVRLSVLQQGDTNLLASIQREDYDANTGEAVQSSGNPLEESTTPLPVTEPEPTHVMPYPKDDHDDDEDIDGSSSQPRAHEQSSLQVSGHRSEKSSASTEKKGNTPTSDAMSAYQFGAVAVMNRSCTDNVPEKLRTTSSAYPNNARKSFDSDGRRVGGNGEQGGNGGSGDGGGSNKESNDSSGSSHGSSKGGNDPDGSGGDSGGGSSETPRKVWETIPGEGVMRRFLALLEAQLVKEKWSENLIWRALVHVKAHWSFPSNVDASLWNIEHASQTSQLTNRLQQGNGSFKVQSAVDSALKEKVVKEAFTIIAEMLAKRKKKALAPKVIMQLMALLDDMNGNMYVGKFRGTVLGLTSLLQNSNMCPVTMLQSTDEEEPSASSRGIDINLEVPFGLSEELHIVGVNDTDRAIKGLCGAMSRAVDEWVSASVGVSGVVVTSGMSFPVRKGYLAPEVARVVDVYKNTTLMIAHIIHRLVVKASQLAPTVNKLFLQRMARTIQVAYLTTDSFQFPVKCSVQSNDLMSLLLRIPNIGGHAVFEVLSALTDARNVADYTEAVRLMTTPSRISAAVTAQEGFVQIQQACIEAVGHESKLLRKIGAMPLCLIIWMESVQTCQPLTEEADRLLDQVRGSYNEQLRRMTSTPNVCAAKLTLSESRVDTLRVLLDDLRCSSTTGAVNVLADAKICTAICNREPTAEEMNAMLLESVCRVLENRVKFEQEYHNDISDAYGAALVFDPAHTSRNCEPSANTNPATVLTEDGLRALVDNMRDIPIGDGAGSVKTIESVLQTAAREADDPFCPPEDRSVGFGAVGSPTHNDGGSVDARIAHILLESSPNERYFTGAHPKGIPAPVLSLGRIFIMGRQKKWLDTSKRTKPGDPPPLLHPPPLSLEESLDLPEFERAVYYALYRGVGTQWNRVVMGKFETLTMGYRDTVRQCKADGNVRKIAQVAWENYEIDDLDDESFAPHAAVAAQLESHKLELDSLRAEMAAQEDARNAKAMAAEQAASEKVKAHELRVSGAVDFLMNNGSGHSRAEAVEAVRGSLSPP